MLPTHKTAVAVFLFLGLILLTGTEGPASPRMKDLPKETHGKSHTFYWENAHKDPDHQGVPACTWRLIIGSKPNSDDKYKGPVLPASSDTHLVDSLPADGKDYWVTPSYQTVCPFPGNTEEEFLPGQPSKFKSGEGSTKAKPAQ